MPSIKKINLKRLCVFLSVPLNPQKVIWIMENVSFKAYFMILVKNSRGGTEVNMINTLSKKNLSKIGYEGWGLTSIWIMS